MYGVFSADGYSCELQHPPGDSQQHDSGVQLEIG